jgi:orotate phosphoribosyltransferase
LLYLRDRLRLEQYKKDFIEFMVRSNVLTFGDFTTKSGRKTPFFINTGNYKTGKQMKQLGIFYAKAIESGIDGEYDVLFGPAYKGIPLVITASIALESEFKKNIAFCFNRKEAKDHGEKGQIIGHKLADDDKIVIVEDVTTAGTSVRESVPLLKHYGKVSVVGLVVSVDRMEKGQTDLGALNELAHDFNMKTTAIVTLDDIVEYLHNTEIDGAVILNDEIKSRIDDYRKIYGIKK